MDLQQVVLVEFQRQLDALNEEVREHCDVALEERGNVWIIEFRRRSAAVWEAQALLAKAQPKLEVQEGLLNKPFTPTKKLTINATTTKQDIKTYFVGYEAEASQYHKGRWTAGLAGSLKEGVDPWYLESIMESVVKPKMPFEDAKQWFYTHFERCHDEHAAAALSDVCKQNGRAVAVYAAEYERHVKESIRSPDDLRAADTQVWMTDHTSYHRDFVKRLDPSVRAKVMSNDNYRRSTKEGYRALVELAVECERTLNQPSYDDAVGWKGGERNKRKPERLPPSAASAGGEQKSPKKPKPQQEDTHVDCDRCGRPHAGGKSKCWSTIHSKGHRIASTPSAPLPDYMAKLTCKTCNTLGHLATACPRKSAHVVVKKFRKPAQGGGDVAEGDVDSGCMFCGTDHNLHDCPIVIRAAKARQSLDIDLD
jgi:hypothetical protein